MIILIVRRLMETTELYVRTSELTNENEQQEVVPSQNQEKKRGTTLQHHQESEKRLDQETRDDSSIVPENSHPGINLSSQLDLPIALRKGTRSCIKYPLSNFVSYKGLSPSYYAFISQISSVSFHNSVQEALSVLERKEAVFEEMRALEKNAIWDKVDMPNGKNVICSKWVFTVKYNLDGSLERYKARLVAKGFAQTYGVDYS